MRDIEQVKDMTLNQLQEMQDYLMHFFQIMEDKANEMNKVSDLFIAVNYEINRRNLKSKLNDNKTESPVPFQLSDFGARYRKYKVPDTFYQLMMLGE